MEEFSVGIGPKLFGFQAFGNEFNLRGLPLGGYVRFPENYNATLVAELQEEAMNRQIDQEKEESSSNAENTALEWTHECTDVWKTGTETSSTRRSQTDWRKNKKHRQSGGTVYLPIKSHNNSNKRKRLRLKSLRLTTMMILIYCRIVLGHNEHSS